MDALRIDPEDFCDKNPTTTDEDTGDEIILHNTVCKYCIKGRSEEKEHFYISELVDKMNFVYPHSDYACSKHSIRINGTCTVME